MRTVIYGRVTAEHLAEAELFSGITPTSFRTDGHSVPPACNLTTEVEPLEPLVTDPLTQRRQNNWRLTIYADALICVGSNPHLIHCAESMGLLIHEA